MDVEQKKMQACFYSLARCLQTDSWRIVSAGDDKTLKVRLLSNFKGLKFLLHTHFISSSPYCKMQCNVEKFPMFLASTTLKILLPSPPLLFAGVTHSPALCATVD